jgi:hypothetical protein
MTRKSKTHRTFRSCIAWFTSMLDPIKDLASPSDLLKSYIVHRYISPVICNSCNVCNLLTWTAT